MEVRMDEGGGQGGQWSKTSAPAHRTCSTGSFVALFFLVLVFGVLVGLFLGESRRLPPLFRDRGLSCQCPASDPSLSHQPTW